MKYDPLAYECHNNCMACDKYKTVKEQNSKCEYRKARGRLTNRMIYAAKKAKGNKENKKGD